MSRLRVCLWAFVLLSLSLPATAGEAPRRAEGWRLPSSSPDAILWWSFSSASKLRPDQAPPEQAGADAIRIRAARNETDAAVLALRPRKDLRDVRIEATAWEPPGDARPGPVPDAPSASPEVEVLEMGTVRTERPTDRSTEAGRWPDPLLPIRGPLALPAGEDHGFWIRVRVPADARPGVWKARLEVRAQGFSADVPLEVRVFSFALPDEMALTTAFGFSAAEAFRYHRVGTDAQKRRLLDLYFDDFAAHHVSPYDPAPLDPIRVTWPDVHPPRSPLDDWQGGRIVGNEVHSGRGALLVQDDAVDENVGVTYALLVPIPPAGFHVHAWFRTPVPGQRFQLSMNHYDARKQWLSGKNLDLVVDGDGTWQEVDGDVTEFPEEARYVRFFARPTPWTDRGEGIGLLWIDDVSITDLATGKEVVHGGDFEAVPRTKPVLPAEQLRPRIEFAAWDAAMERAIRRRHVNSFRLPIQGMGSGSFHGIRRPSLLGFGEETPEYPLLFGSYVRMLEQHLREKGWLDLAYVYWFDEPEPSQYAFVRSGFERLRRFAPGIRGMLTEQVEDTLVGGPEIWCPISPRYDAKRIAERQAKGEQAWWYVCTSPKSPYAGLFLDHPGPELRVWIWQTWKRGIQGVLVWETDYWTSPSAYPDAASPQDPYEDPMSWTSGLPAGTRHPWGNGDGRFLYPPPDARPGHGTAPVLQGPVDSIRWEQLRDGIEDYEYLALLRDALRAKGPSLSPDERARLEGLLVVPDSITTSRTRFTRSGAPIEARRNEIAKALEALSSTR